MKNTITRIIKLRIYNIKMSLKKKTTDFLVVGGGVMGITLAKAIAIRYQKKLYFISIYNVIDSLGQGWTYWRRSHR